VGKKEAKKSKGVQWQSAKNAFWSFSQVCQLVYQSWFYLVHIFGSNGKRRWLVVVQEVAKVVDQEYQVSKYPSIKRK